MLFDSQTNTAEIERIRAMKMSEFSQAGSWAKIASDLFPHSEIYFASDPVMAREVRKIAPKAVIYGPGELARILALNPGKETMKAIHQAKAILKGRAVVDRNFAELPELPADIRARVDQIKEANSGKNRERFQRDMDTGITVARPGAVSD